MSLIDPAAQSAGHDDDARREPEAAVPERPTLAAGVELAGEMQQTGFRDRQWLLVRDGRYLQVSELLFRVAEFADGRRTLGEIAAAVTDRCDHTLTADHVRRIVATKLLPLGVIAGEDGSTATPPASAPSPLQMNMRMKTIGPRIIDPVTDALRFLYRPAVLAPILVGVAAVHAWLYLDHGMSRVLVAVLSRPILIVPVFLVIMLAGVAHEFGHATALRYGGGRSRAMGFGFYLIYPALYTDTSDGYRLGRRARVRIDLGGFYFHLLAAVAVVAVAVLSGHEYLLLAVFVINLEMLRQLLFPFVRFDGYWLLADLTGIPDLFTYLGPFLRSLRPGRPPSPAMPALRRWVRVVFGLYAAVTIPVLAGLAVLFVRRAPGFVAVAWASTRRLAQALAAAWASGDVLAAALSGVQILILLLPVVGAGYMLWSLAATVAHAVTRRRAVVAEPVSQLP